MNFALIFKYLGLLLTIATAIEALAQQVAAGQPASTPPLSTYLEGKHGTITVVWSPIA